MPRTKKQHYVPQFLLRRFATASRKNPKIWTLDKATKAMRLSSVRDVAHENGFYEYSDDEGTRVELEDLMAGIDSMGAQTIARILEKGALRLPSKDRVCLSYFVACQMSRTPMIRKEMENFRPVQ